MKRVGLSFSLALILGAGCGKDDSPVGDSEMGENNGHGAADGGTSHADAGKVTVRKDAGGGGGGNNTPIGQTDSGNDLCSSRTVMATATIPDVLIVLDASASMLAARWAPSLMAVRSLTTQYQQQVAFGLEIFPPGGLPGCGGGNLDVMMSVNNAMQIDQTVSAILPAGFTPTGPALDNALMYLGDRTPQIGDTGGGQVTPGNVLLVTDGEPDCPGDPVASATALANASIKTYVVGYQIDPVGQTLMNQIATVGMTDHYYAVENGNDLQDAFTKILQNLVSCEFDLSEVPDDPTYVLVTIDGKPVVLNAADGWVLDGTKVTLQGGSCGTLKDGTAHTLNVGIECTQQVYL